MAPMLNSDEHSDGLVPVRATANARILQQLQSVLGAAEIEFVGTPSDRPGIRARQVSRN